MLAKTAAMIKGLAEMDGTITPEQLQAGLKTLAGETSEPGGSDIVNKEPIDRLLSVGQVAEILNLSTKSVLRYCKNGLLRRIVRRGGKRATGILESSVRAFVAEKEAA